LVPTLTSREILPKSATRGIDRQKIPADELGWGEGRWSRQA
jgi:hypothetical protein